MFDSKKHSFDSVYSWFLKKDSIDFNPDFQRISDLWSHKKKCMLIDSIINNYDIPKFYVADFISVPSKLNRSKKRYALIDGKQRFSVLFAFFSDDLKLSSDVKMIEYPDINFDGLTYSQIKAELPHIAKKIESFEVTVVHVETDESYRIGQLFLRLNSGLSLSGAEKRSAMNSPLPNVIKRISDHDFFSKFVSYKARRGQNQNAVAKLLLFEYSNKICNTKANDLDSFVDLGLELGESRCINLGNKVELILDRMCYIFNVNDRLLNSEGEVPVYYWIVREFSLNETQKLASMVRAYRRSLGPASKNRNRSQLIAGLNKVISDYTNNENGLLLRIEQRIKALEDCELDCFDFDN
jgi:hypothetical protein